MFHQSILSKISGSIRVLSINSGLLSHSLKTSELKYMFSNMEIGEQQ